MTTTKLYPAYDIAISRDAGGETFAQIIGGDGTATENSADPWLPLLSGEESPLFDILTRMFFTFDTSALGAGVTVTGARFGFTANSKGNDLGSPAVTITGANPANPTSMAAGDYDTVEATSLGTVAYASITADNATYNVIALNASGLAEINKTGYTVLVARLGWDVDGSFGGAWDGPWANSHVAINMSEIAGTDKDPYLEIDYTVSAGVPVGPSGGCSINSGCFIV